MKNSVIIEMLQESDLIQYRDLSFVLETCGIELVKLLIANAEGFDIHIPQIKSITPLIRRYIINSHQKGTEDHRIASDLGMTITHVRRIIKRHEKTNAQP